MKKIAALLLTSLLSTSLAQSLPQATREKIIKATVMLMPTGPDGKLDGSLGSGTIISPEGYILTNYHVVGDVDNRQLSEWIMVRTIRFVDQSPVPSYWGQVVAADPNLDLAIVKIVQDKDEKPVGTLNLPYMMLGDSNKLMLGDPIYVFGFQGTGGNTLSYSSGSVGGFTGDDFESSGRQWIKHDAQTGPGNSGGGVYNDQGDLIGVHSAGIAGQGNSRTAFLRPVAVAWGLITPNVPKFAVRPGTGSTATAGGSSSGGSTTKTTTSTSGGSGGVWPPAVTTGQTWSIALQGDKIDEVWKLQLTSKTSKGTPTGTAVSAKRQTPALMYYVQKDDVLWFDLPIKGDEFYSCGFQKSGAKSDGWVGDLLYFKDGDSDGVKVGVCGAVLGTGSAGTATSGSSTGSTTGSGGNTARLTWPLRPQPGQRWQVDVTEFGKVDVNLTGKTQSGLPSGNGLIGGKIKVDTLFYYEEKEKTTWLDMVDDSSMLYCAFTQDGLSGNTIKGTAYYRKDKNSNADAEEIGTCTARLN